MGGDQVMIFLLDAGKKRSGGVVEPLGRAKLSRVGGSRGRIRVHL